VLSCEAKILYQYLLLTALRQRKGSVSVYKDHISTLLTIHKGAVKGPLNELKDNDFIRLRGHIYSIEKNKRECEKKETATNPLNGGGGLSAKEISEEIKKLRLGSNLSK
jgi:hypothetical protein